MRVAVRSSALTSAAVAGIGALAITSVAPVPVPAAFLNPRVSHEISLAASPAPGALVFRGLANQVENFQLQWPFIKYGVVDAPTAVLLTPLTFGGALLQSGSLPKAIGLTGASITGPVSYAWGGTTGSVPGGGIIGTDLEQILPRFQNSVAVAIVGGFNVGSSLSGGLPAYFQALDTNRNDLYGALNQPLTPNPGNIAQPDTVPEVIAVESWYTVNAVVFGGGELLLLGVIQAPDSFYQTLGSTGDIAASVEASADTLLAAGAHAGAVASTAVEDAVVAVKNALNGQFPAAITADAKLADDQEETARGADTQQVGNQSQPSANTRMVTLPTGLAKSGPTTLLRPSFKAIVGPTGRGAGSTDNAPGSAIKSAVGQVQARMSKVGNRVKKVTDDIKTTVTPPKKTDAKE